MLRSSCSAGSRRIPMDLLPTPRSRLVETPNSSSRTLPKVRNLHMPGTSGRVLEGPAGQVVPPDSFGGPPSGRGRSAAQEPEKALTMAVAKKKIGTDDAGTRSSPEKSGKGEPSTSRSAAKRKTPSSISAAKGKSGSTRIAVSSRSGSAKAAPSAKATTSARAGKSKATESAKSVAKGTGARKGVATKKLGKRFLEAVRSRLEDERARLVSQLEELERERRILAEDREDRDDAFTEESGEGAGTLAEQEREESLAVKHRELLEKVERALAKIRKGTYGLCERCGNPIDRARLEALPHAELCIECKRKEERRF